MLVVLIFYQMIITGSYVITTWFYMFWEKYRYTPDSTKDSIMQWTFCLDISVSFFILLSHTHFCFSFQARTRERLVNLLTCFGQRVGLPKSPSVSTCVLCIICRTWNLSGCVLAYIVTEWLLLEILETGSRIFILLKTLLTNKTKIFYS